MNTPVPTTVTSQLPTSVAMPMSISVMTSSPTSVPTSVTTSLPTSAVIPMSTSSSDNVITVEKKTTHTRKEKIITHVKLLKKFALKVGTYGFVQDVDAVRKELVEFENELYRVAAQDASECKLYFGKHKGMSIHELWNDDKKRGKSYLKWLVNQEWCFDDLRPIIMGLINLDFEAQKNKVTMQNNHQRASTTETETLTQLVNPKTTITLNSNVPQST